MTSGLARSAPARAQSDDKRVHIVQGEFHVTSDERIVLSTILGSCVTACLRDPVARVGGMNHFLLPDGDSSDPVSRGLQYGVHAMELLVNGVLQQGGRRDRLEAKLFGGARLQANLPDIGGKNATFATEFLRREGIAHTGGSLRGFAARRIQFWPCLGRARQAMVSDQAPALVAAEQQRPPPRSADLGAVELF